MAVTVWTQPIQGIIGLPVIYRDGTGVELDGGFLSVKSADKILAVWGAAAYQRAEIT